MTAALTLPYPPPVCAECGERVFRLQCPACVGHKIVHALGCDGRGFTETCHPCQRRAARKVAA